MLAEAVAHPQLDAVHQTYLNVAGAQQPYRYFWILKSKQLCEPYCEEVWSERVFLTCHGPSTVNELALTETF